MPRFNLSTPVNSLSQIQSCPEVLGLGLLHKNFVGDTNQSRTSVQYSHFTDEEFDLGSSKARKRVRCEVTVPLGRSDSRSKLLFDTLWGFPSGSNSKESACSAGDPGSITGSGRSPGERNGNPLQYSWLENPMHRGAWQATVHGVTKSQT